MLRTTSEETSDATEAASDDAKLASLRDEQAQGVLGKLAKMRKESIVMFEP